MPAPTGRGRFDLPRAVASVLYLAEDGEHAVAELLQPWRNRRLEPWHLERAGRPLGLVRITMPREVRADLLDLCRPATLRALSIDADTTASRDRERTKDLARRAWDAGAPGLRWWSAFHGDWHTVVFFADRAAADLEFHEPEPLTLEHPAIARAAAALGMG